MVRVEDPLERTCSEKHLWWMPGWAGKSMKNEPFSSLNVDVFTRIRKF